jgi:hypothetical protein
MSSFKRDKKEEEDSKLKLIEIHYNLVQFIEK